MTGSKIKAFRELKKEFERFPNSELAESIELGRIGYYDNRKARFQWRTTLGNLNINTTPKVFKDSFPCVDEIYTTGNAVNCTFSLGVNQYGNADFKFSKSYSIATQATGMTISGYDIVELERDILEAIEQNNLEWDEKWVVVTQIFQAPSYSLLISGNGNSEASLSTSIPISTTGFNIADSALGIVVARLNKMAYQSVAKTNVTPFFKIHKLKGWSKLRLEPYGIN